MRHLTKIIVSSLVFFSAQAFAQPMAIVCFSDTVAGEGLSLYLDTENPGVGFHATIGGVESSFISSPSAWGEAHSFTRIENGVFRAQVISGNPIDPIIDSSIEVHMAPETPGRMKLLSASIYYNSVAYNVDSLVGTSCYVQ